MYTSFASDKQFLCLGYDTFHDQKPIWVSDVPIIKVSYFNIEMLNFVWYNCPLTYSMGIYAKNCSISLKIQKIMIFKGSMQVNRKFLFSLFIICQMWVEMTTNNSVYFVLT